MLMDVCRAALRSPEVGTVTVFCSGAGERDFDLPSDVRLRVVEPRVLASRGPLRLAWHLGGLSASARAAGVDALLCLAGVGASKSGPDAVTFIQQSLPFCPEALDRCTRRVRARLLVLEASMRRSCRNSRAVIVQTPTMSRWVRERFQVPADRVVTVMPAAHGAAEDTVPRAALDKMRSVPAGARLLYVGTNAPYKNLAIVVRSMRRLRTAQPDATLFVTLPKGTLEEPGVECLGYLSELELDQAYRLATVLVMPSLVETVGLPLIEGLARGVPILAADRPYAHDVCTNAAEFFDPMDPDSYVSTVRRLLLDASLRTRLSRRALELAKEREKSRPYDQMIQHVLKRTDTGSGDSLGG